MDLHEEIDDALENLECNLPREERLSLLNGLRDRLMFNQFERGYLEGRLENLIDLIPMETDRVVRTHMFEVLERAMSVHYTLIDLSVDTLVPYFSEDDPAFIAHTLLLLPLNGDRKYLPLVERYRDHANEFVRRNAEYAWKYMRGDDRREGHVP